MFQLFNYLLFCSIYMLIVLFLFFYMYLKLLQSLGKIKTTDVIVTMYPLDYNITYIFLY